MAPWSVYPNPGSRDQVPCLEDVQTDTLSGLRTWLVVPHTRVGVGLPRPPRRLAPQFTIDGERLALAPHLAAGLDARLLKGAVASLAAHAGEVRDALDAVIGGV